MGTALLAPPNLQAALEQLGRRVESYSVERHSKRTRVEYASRFRSFERWAGPLRLCTLPASPATIAGYMTFMADRGYKLSTLEQSLAAIGWKHRQAGHDWFPGQPEIARTMKGIRRTIGRAQRRVRALDGATLERMVQLLPVDEREPLMLRAMLTVGWFGALRRIEIAELEREHLRFEDAGGREWLRVHLPKRKTDQEGLGTELALCEQPGSSACPVRTMAAWLELCGVTSGRVFPKTPQWTAQWICTQIQTLAGRLGLEAHQYGGHSLRAGLITQAALQERSLHAIMRQSGHKSEKQTLSYIRPATVTLNNVTEGILR